MAYMRRPRVEAVRDYIASGRNPEHASGTLDMDESLTERILIYLAGFKLCPSCNVAKPLHHFRHQPAMGDQRNATCYPCERAALLA
jgi:hypothetical protein